MTEDKELPLTSPLSTAYGGRTDASVSNRVRCRAGGTAGAKDRTVAMSAGRQAEASQGGVVKLSICGAAQHGLELLSSGTRLCVTYRTEGRHTGGAPEPQLTTSS